MTPHLQLAPQFDFLRRMLVTPVEIQFEALTPVAMPPFPGPALRGALGTALLEAWCESRPLCSGDCAHPGSCRFYDRFAREREEPGAGENQPKPWILRIPSPPGLTALVTSGTPVPPYGRGPAIPGSFEIIERRQPWLLPAGARFDIRISLIGRHGAWAYELAEVLRGRVFTMGHRAGKFAVCELPAVLPAHGLVAAPAPARLARLELLTPLRVDRTGGWSGTVEGLAREVARSAMVRAVKLFDSFCRNSGERLPRLDLPPHEFTVRRSKLWRYWLPRTSYKQGRAMEIGGIVGSMDIEGNLTPLLPFFRAAEVLHAGQKATFGMGRIRTVLWN